MFQTAVRRQQWLRLALCGPPGSGKTFSALRIAAGLVDPGQQIAGLDSEHGSMSLYAGEANPDGGTFEFVVCDLEKLPGQFKPENYIKALRAAKAAKIPCVIIDSGSHAWAAVLAHVDAVKSRSNSKNGFNAWGEGTKLQDEFVNEILSYPGHVIFTMRSKMAYEVEESGGKKTPKKIGMAPVQREGVEYEFTVVIELDAATHTGIVTKSRCAPLADRVFVKPGADVAQILRDWLAGGAPEGVPSDAGPSSDKGEAPPAQPSPSTQSTPNAEPECASEEEMRPFLAGLHDLGIDADSLAAFTAAKGMGHPETWTTAKRDNLLERLGTEPGRAVYNAWRTEAGAR